MILRGSKVVIMPILSPVSIHAT